jgi:hypothetical protein
MEDVCIVTAFFDIGRGFWSSQYKRTTKFYLQSFLNYLEYPYKMVCFIDDRCIDYVLEHYTRSHHSNKLFIPINKEWMENNIRAWQQMGKDEEIMKSQQYRDWIDHRKTFVYPNGDAPADYTKHIFPENQDPRYNAINHAKVDFIAHAIKNGYVKESVTGWCDFGYFGTQHDNDKTTFPTATIDKTYFKPDRITFFLRKDVDEKDTDPLYTLVYAPEVFTGTFWGGPTQLMSTLQTLYHETVDELYAVNISDDDQHIYLRCYLKNLNLFDLKLATLPEWPKGLLYLQKMEG